MFYIIDQGIGIKTPIDTLLKPRGVSRVSASLESQSVTHGDDDTSAQYHSSKEAIEGYKEQQQLADERNKLVIAKQIMSSPVVTASVDLTLIDIWAHFSRQSIHHLPLLDNEQRLQGIVSDRDVLRFAANNNYRNSDTTPIYQLMSRQVVSAQDTTSIRTLAEVMSKRGFGAIPIVDENVEVVGIVTRSDILRAVVHQAPLEMWS